MAEGCELVDRMRTQPLIRPIFTGADVSGGAVLAGLIGSRPLRDLFVAVLLSLSLKFPLKIWALPPQTGFCAGGLAGHQGIQRKLFGA